MSTIDFNSLARTGPLSPASLSLNAGLRGGASPSPDCSSEPICGVPERTGGEHPQRQEHPDPREAHPAPCETTVHRVDAPLTNVAQLHTEAERSRSAGLPLAVAKAVDRTAAPVTSSPGIVRHRVREVRREQGISIKRASQHLGVSVEEARRQEDPTCDLTMSQLQAWQKLCETPIADLLVEPNCELSAPVLQRARMVRVMKTVQAIMERTGQTAVKRLGQTLVNQLVELMPELKGVSSWHAVERRQSCNQNARILESNYLRAEEEETRD